MDEVFEKLRNLQDILSEKITLEREIQEAPKILSAQEELLLRMKRTFVEKNQDYDKVKETEAFLRNQLAEAEAARENAEKHMEAISTQREYEALDKEIREAAEKEQQLRKDLQKQEKTLQDLSNQVQQATDLITQQEDDLKTRRKGIEDEVKEKQARVDTLNARQEELTQGLDPELFFKFERIIRNKMGQGIVAIKGGVCMGCHMILPAQFANDVRRGEEVVFCPYCSRILFYEESGAEEDDFFDDADAGSLADLDDDVEEEEDDEEEEIVNIDNEE